MRPALDAEQADLTIHGVPFRLQTALEFFRMKAMANWGADVKIAAWDTWDHLGDRLGARLGQHIWHPVHWEDGAPRDR